MSFLWERLAGKFRKPWPLSKGTGVFLESKAMELNSSRNKLISTPTVWNKLTEEQGLLGSSTLMVTRATWLEVTPEGLKGKS